MAANGKANATNFRARDGWSSSYSIARNDSSSKRRNNAHASCYAKSMRIYIISRKFGFAEYANAPNNAARSSTKRFKRTKAEIPAKVCVKTTNKTTAHVPGRNRMSAAPASQDKGG